MRFRDILLENVVLNATKPVVVPGDHETAQAVEILGLTNSLEDWAHNRYSKWVIHVKEANPEWKEFIGSEQIRSWYTGVLVKYIIKDKNKTFLPIAPPHIHFDKIPHKDEIKGLNWAIENGQLNQIRYFPADDGKIHMDLRNQLEEAEHFFTSLMYDIFAQPHIPGNADEATTKRLMQVHKQQKTNAEKLLKNIARSPMDQLLQQWAKYNQKRPTVKAEQIEDQTKVFEDGEVTFWRLDSEQAFKATGSALKNCIGSMYHYKPEEYQIYVLRDKGTEQAAIAIQVGEDRYSYSDHLPAVRENKGYNNRPTPAIYTDSVVKFLTKLEVKGVMGAGARDNHSMGLMNNAPGEWKNVRTEYPLNKTNITYKLDDTYTIALPSEPLIDKTIELGKEMGRARIKVRDIIKSDSQAKAEEERKNYDRMNQQFTMLLEFVSKHVETYKIRHIFEQWADEGAKDVLIDGKIKTIFNNLYTILDSKDRAIIDFRVDDQKLIDRWVILIDSRAPFLSHVKHIHDAGIAAGVAKEIERHWLERHGVVKGKQGAYHPYMEKYSPKKIKESGNYTLWRHTGSPGKIDEYWDVNDKKTGRYSYDQKASFKDIAQDWRNNYSEGLIKMRFYYIGDSSGRPMIALGVGDQKVETDRYSLRLGQTQPDPYKNILGEILVARKPQKRSNPDDSESELIDDPDPERGILWRSIHKSSEIEHVQNAFKELLPVPGKIDYIATKLRKIAYLIGWGDALDDTINKDLSKGWRNAKFNKNKVHLGLNTITNTGAFDALKPATQKKITSEFKMAMKSMMPTFEISPPSRYRMIKYGVSRSEIGSEKRMFLSNLSNRALSPENQGVTLHIGMNWKDGTRGSHDNTWHIFAKAYDVKKEIYDIMLPKMDQLWTKVEKEIKSDPGLQVTFGHDFASIFAPQIKKWKDEWYVPFMTGLNDQQILNGIAGVISPDLGALNWKVEKDFGINVDRDTWGSMGNKQGRLKGKDILPWLELTYEYAKGDIHGPAGQEEAQRYNVAMKAWDREGKKGPEPKSKANLVEPKEMLNIMLNHYKKDYLPKLYKSDGWKSLFGTRGFRNKISLGNLDEVYYLRHFIMGQNNISDPTHFFGQVDKWADDGMKQYKIGIDMQKINPEQDIAGISPEMRERILADDEPSRNIRPIRT